MEMPVSKRHTIAELRGDLSPSEIDDLEEMMGAVAFDKAAFAADVADRMRRVGPYRMAADLGISLHALQKYASPHGKPNMAKFCRVCSYLKRHPARYFRTNDAEVPA